MFGREQPRWVDLPTYAFQRQRYWPRPVARAAGGLRVAGADGAEAGFWAAVDQADVDALADAVGADEQVRSSLEQMAGVLPVLSRWRARRREQAVLDGWRYRVAWQPVADPEPGTLSGRWLLVVPVWRWRGRGWPVVVPGCWLTAARRWSPLRWICPGWTAAALAARLGEVAGGGGGRGCGVAAGCG